MLGKRERFGGKYLAEFKFFTFDGGEGFFIDFGKGIIFIWYGFFRFVGGWFCVRFWFGGRHCE